MILHIIDSDTDSFVPNTMTSANCGKTVKFYPVSAEFSDGRICEECLRVHRSIYKTFTFVIID